MPVSSPALIGKNFICNFFVSCVKDCIVDMVTFAGLVGILSLESHNTKIAGLGENFSAMWYFCFLVLADMLQRLVPNEG